MLCIISFFQQLLHQFLENWTDRIVPRCQLCV